MPALRVTFLGAVRNSETSAYTHDRLAKAGLSWSAVTRGMDGFHVDIQEADYEAALGKLREAFPEEDDFTVLPTENTPRDWNGAPAAERQIVIIKNKFGWN